jgi:hypothetical protein
VSTPYGVLVIPALDADLAGGRGREFRVTGNMEGTGRHEVCELTESGLQVRIGGLERWQALAIVAVLHPPFD